MSIFKDCDIRGIVPEEINEEITYATSWAFGSFFLKGELLVVGGEVHF